MQSITAVTSNDDNDARVAGSLPAVMALMEKSPEGEGEGGDTAVCYCMAAALASLILDEEAMEAVVLRQEAAPLFENCLSLLARTLQSLEPQAQVRCRSHVYRQCCLGQDILDRTSCTGHSLNGMLIV